MKKKGQLGIGSFVVIAVAVIVALVLFTASAPNIGTTVNTNSLVNGTYTAPAAASTIDLIGQELLSTPIVTNATSGATVPSSNYTIAETISATDGLKRITYTTNTGPYESQSVNVSYDYGAEGYIDNAGGRSLANVILLLAALAIAVVVMGKVLKEGGFAFGK